MKWREAREFPAHFRRIRRSLLAMAGLVISAAVLGVFALPRMACAQPYTLGVEASPALGGAVTKTPDKPTYNQDEWVTIEATPSPGWLFMGFSGLPSGGGSGNGSGNGATISFNITGDTQVTGYFTPGRLIPDDNLRQAIADALGKAPEEITLVDLQGLASLDASGRGIVDLTGLQHCISLNYLYLYDNQISDISALAGLTNLTELNLGGNQISDLSPLSGLVGLQRLGLLGCRFNDFSVLFSSVLSQLPNLSDLDLTDTALTDGDIVLLSTLTDLEGLNVGWNQQVHDFSPLSAMTSLKELLLNGCTGEDPADLVSMVSGLPGLTSLHLRWLNLTDSDIVPLASMTNLVSLNLNYNLIADLSPLSGLTALRNLSLQNNQISDLQPLVDNPGLGAGDEVFLENNPLGETALDVQVPALLARGVGVRYDVPAPPSGVTIIRGIDYEVPNTALDDSHEYSVEIVGHGIREIQITTPWNQTVTLSDLLPAAWNGSGKINVTRGALDFGAECFDPAGDTSYKFGWDWLTDDQWAALDSASTMITVRYGPHAGDLWSPTGGLNFAAVTQHTQEPLPDVPTYRNVEPGNLTVQWPPWQSPPAGGIVRLGIDEEPPWWGWTGNEYEEETMLPPQATSWAPPPLPVSDGVYELEIDFADAHSEAVDGVQVQTVAYTENDVSFVVTNAVDDHGNTTGQATPISIPASFTAAIDYFGDIDFFSFTALAGQTYDILIRLPQDGLDDSTVWLYDTDGRTRLAWNDDGGYDGGSRLVWTAPANGTYYLAVDAYEFFDTVGQYTVDVSLSSLISDTPAAVFSHPAQHWLAAGNRLLGGSEPYTGAETGDSGIILHLFDVRAWPPDGQVLFFDFEEFDATSERFVHPGALTTLQSTADGVTVTITRTGGQRFDVLQCTQPDFPGQWGGRALDPWYQPDTSGWFVATFSVPLVYAELQLTDFGEDDDTVFMKIYEGPDGTGTRLDTVQEHWGTASSPAFAAISYAANPDRPFRSILFRGYSTNRANSMYADNLAVATEAEPPSGPSLPSQGDPLPPVERSACFLPAINGLALYANETHLCLGDNSNARDSEDGWSDLVLLDLEGVSGIQEVGRLACRNRYVDGLAVMGDYLYVGTQPQDESLAYLEVYRFLSPTELVFVTQSAALTAPPGAEGDFDPETIALTSGRAYIAHDNGVISILNIADPQSPPQLLGQYDLGSQWTRDMKVASGPAGDILWVGSSWSLLAIDVADPADPQLLATLPMGAAVNQIIIKGKVALVDCLGVGVRVLDIADPSEPVILHTFHVNGATGWVALAGHHLYVPTGAWKTAIFALPSDFAAWCRTDRDWVYQNTPGTLSKGGHKVRLTTAALDFAGNGSYTVSVAKVPGSGPGEVTVQDDPGGNPLVKYVYGSLRSDGVAGAGPLTLRVTVTGNVAGQQTLDLPLTVRPLGDIDGNGAPEPGDVSALIMKLNGVPPEGYDDQAFDLDANGAAEPGDVQYLMNLLNNLPIP